MRSFELAKKLSGRAEFSFFRVFKSLADSFLCIGASGNIEQEHYIRIQGEEPSMQASFLGIGRSFTASDLQQFENCCSRSGWKYLVIE